MNANHRKPLMKQTKSITYCGKPAGKERKNHHHTISPSVLIKSKRMEAKS